MLIRPYVGFAAYQVFFLLVFLCNPARFQASGIRVVQDQAVQKQGKITFTVSMVSSARIDQVSLIYGKAGHGCSSDQALHKLDFKPEMQISTHWDWDLQGGAFLPGMEIWWQWIIQDEAGHVLMNDRQSLILQDLD